MIEPIDIDALIAQLKRAHRMSSSDPEASKTLYGSAADALESTIAELHRLGAERSEVSQLSHHYRSERDKAREVISDAYGYLNSSHGWLLTGMPGMRNILGRGLVSTKAATDD